MAGPSRQEETEVFFGEEEAGIGDALVLEDLQGDELQDGDSDSGEGSEGDDVIDMSFHGFVGHTDGVLAVAWSPASADIVATGGVDDRGFLWRVGEQAFEDTAGTLSTHALDGHRDSVVALQFNHQGTLLASGAMDGTVRVWNSSGGELVASLDGPGGSIEWLNWHPKGNVILAGSEDFTVWMWLAQTGACMQVFAGHSGPVSCGQFTPDGKVVVTAGCGEDDASLRSWNPKTGECMTLLQGHPFHEQGITALAVHSDCATVLTGALDGSLRVSNLNTKRVLGSLSGHAEESIEAVGFSQHLPLAASAGVDGKLLVWDLSTLSLRGTCEHSAQVTRMAWHPAQPLVFTACLDGVARCWDLRTSSCVHEYTGHTDGIQDICLSPDGSMLLTGSDDHTARVFMSNV